MRKRGDVLKGAKGGKEKTSQERGEDQRGKEKERRKGRVSGKGVDGGGVKFGMIESERSEDLDSVAVVFHDDDVVVLTDCHSTRTDELTRT